VLQLLLSHHMGAMLPGLALLSVAAFLASASEYTVAVLSEVLTVSQELWLREVHVPRRKQKSYSPLGECRDSFTENQAWT